MPSCDGMALVPGRDRVSEKKRDEGATAVMPNKLEVNEAPSRLFPGTGVMDCAIREFEGRARPRMPLNSCSRGSESTLVAAAIGYTRQQFEQRKIGGAVPRAWLPMEYPPTYTSSQYTGPLTFPARYWIEKFDWAAIPEFDGSY